MFSLFGADEILRNVYRVSHPFASEASISTSMDLRPYFLEFLSNHQPYMPVNRDSSKFILDIDIENELARAYSIDNALNDLNQADIIGGSYPHEVKLKKIDLARLALEEFLGLDDMLSIIFDLCIHSIFIKPSNVPQGRKSYGGSSSAAIGAIWMTVDDTVTKLDLMEMFVHELTHHLLFIDERNYPQFDYDEITKESNYAFSAILNKMRPLDKVVHSVVVATELILARERFLTSAGERVIHPDTEILIENAIAARDSIYSLPNIDRIIKPRTEAILERCMSHCTNLMMAKI